MATITLTLRDKATGETGSLVWDQASGRVTGFRAEQLERFGQVPWSYSPLSHGDGTQPALRSNDGMIAMLLSLGYDSPPELVLDREPVGRTPPGAVN